MQTRTRIQQSVLQSRTLTSAIFAFVSGCVFGALLVKLGSHRLANTLEQYCSAVLQLDRLSFGRAYSLCVKVPFFLLLCCFLRPGYVVALLTLFLRGGLAAFFMGSMAISHGTAGFLAGFGFLLFHCCVPLVLMLFLVSFAGSIPRPELYWRQSGRWRAALLLLALVLLVSLACALGEWLVRPRLVSAILRLGSS